MRKRQFSQMTIHLHVQDHRRLASVEEHFLDKLLVSGMRSSKGWSCWMKQRGRARLGKEMWFGTLGLLLLHFELVVLEDQITVRVVPLVMVVVR